MTDFPFKYIYVACFCISKYLCSDTSRGLLEYKIAEYSNPQSHQRFPSSLRYKMKLIVCVYILRIVLRAYLKL